MTKKTSQRTLIVPCYNEASRLDTGAWTAVAKAGLLRLIFVDDGSSDATFEVLGAIERSAPEAVRVVRLPKNVGKGEAVRVGLTVAMNAGDELVGYADADLATPPEEVLRLFEALAEAPHLVAVIGSRINYLGTNIRRRPSRHYLGRVFATAAATALGREIYDTQCGAKVFRTGPLLAAALSLPFVSRWAFDVELLGRIFDGSPTRATVAELPLRTWTHVGGSKLHPIAMVKATTDLVRIALRRRIKR